MKNNFVRPGFCLIMVTVIQVMLPTGFFRRYSKEPVKSSGKGFAVIELFTSEGLFPGKIRHLQNGIDLSH